MIELTLTSGNAVWVNPKHIVAMQQVDGCTHIVMMTSQFLVKVSDTPQTVMDLIEESNNKKEEAR